LYPGLADVFEAATYGALATLLLSLPLLLQKRPAPAASADTARTDDSASRSANRSRSVPSLPPFQWGRAGWGLLALSGAVALTWMFVSLGAMVIDPERAVAWSFHMLGSLFAVMFLAPLVVFLQPSDPPPSDEQAGAFASNDPAVATNGEVQESTNFIPSFFSGSASSSKRTEPAGSSEPYDESELRSIWSYAEEDAARDGSASGDGAANRNPERPHVSSSSGSPTASSAPGSKPSAQEPPASESPSDAPAGGWPWADETAASDRSPGDTEEFTDWEPVESEDASDPADTQWADSMWPPEDESGAAGNGSSDASSMSTDDDTWPPANWPSLDDY